MFLQRLILENVKALEKLDLDFTDIQGHTRKWTLIVGDNGSGRSTILKSIALLLGGSEALPELLGNPDSWIRLGQDKCSFTANLMTAGNEARTITLTLERGDNLRKIFQRNEESLAALDGALAHASRNYFTVAYGANRRIAGSASLYAPVTTGGMVNPRAQAVATLFTSDAALSPIESWALDLHYRKGEQGLRLINKALKGLLPNAEFAEIDKENHQLTFSTPEGKLSASMLSDAYLNITAWYGDFLYRITQAFSNYSNPLSARGLLVIDEIDVHLDASWKRQLFTFLDRQFPQMQIVATTDSPFMVQQAGEGEVFAIRRPAPHASPTLYHFEGAPRNLLLQQLVLSPIFEMETVDSTQTEAARQSYDRLASKSKDSLTTSEKRELSKANQRLQQSASWTTGVSEIDEERARLEEARNLLKEEMEKAQRRRK